MVWSTLIPVRALAEHLGHPDWVVVDCRFDLTESEAGRRAYAFAHIPGAHYAHLDEDLSGPTTEHSGRHPLPDVATFIRWLEHMGIGNATQVVAYDAGPGAIAARLWWLLRWLGHEAVAVLDGGFLAWQALGDPISRARPRARPAHFQGRPGTMPVIDTETLSRERAHYRIVDARVSERFRGDVEPVDAIAGHVPGACNRPFPANLGPAGGFLDRPSLRAAWSELVPASGAAALVAMCGSGVTACHHVLALEHAGWHGAKLYPGSWSEWIRDPARPVAHGDSCGPVA